jgi:AraC family transcriptional regulator, exoenzyme S synthesis regulatory protein ExsA
MKTYNLPQDLTPANVQETDPIIIRRYQSEHNTIRNRIILHMNMINLLISGEKTIIHAEGTTTVHEGELLILSCGNCLTTEVLPVNELFSSIILYFSNELLTDFLHKHEYSGRQDKEPGRPFLIFKQDAFISNYVTSLRLLLQLPSPLLPEFKKLKLEELLLYLLGKDPQKLYSLLIVAENDEDLQLRKAVESNIGTPVTVEELAFLCNCSLSTFKRKFKNIYHLPPQKWLLEQKMQLAADLLKHPQEKPGIVYQKVGYENHSSFTQSFKKQYGMTPKEYQERNLAL